MTIFYRPETIRPSRIARLTRAALYASLGILLVQPGAIAKRQAAPPQATFSDMSAKLDGFTHTNIEPAGDNAGGTAIFDCDNDGDLDIYLSNGNGADDGLMVNDGFNFTNTTGAGAGDIGDGNGSSGVAAADLDNDGYTDLVVAGDAAFLKGFPAAKQIRVYRNNGNCNFTDVTDDAFDNITTDAGSAMHPAIADINNDGLVDIFVTAPSSLTTEFIPFNSMFLNNGNFDFTDISQQAGDIYYDHAACDAAFTHFNDDNYIDLIISDCNFKLDRPAYQDWVNENFVIPPFVATGIRLMINNGDNTFTETEANLPTPLPPDQQPFIPDERGFWMSTTLGDIDADGDFDFFSTTIGDFWKAFPGGENITNEHFLAEQLDDGTFAELTDAGLDAMNAVFGWGAEFEDFNNDRWEDLFSVGNLPEFGDTGHPGFVYVNKRDKTFRSDPLPVDLGDRFSVGVAAGDLDNDGRVDIVVNNGRLDTTVVLPAGDGKPTLLRNTSVTGNSWVQVKLVGTTSNRGAIGAQIKVRSGGVNMLREIRSGENFLSTSSPWQTFGLGASKKKKINVRVRWPLGNVEQFKVRTKRINELVEGTGRKIRPNKEKKRKVNKHRRHKPFYQYLPYNPYHKYSPRERGRRLPHNPFHKYLPRGRARR